MNCEKTRALIGLNIGVLIMSMAGIFAKLISWHPVLIILGRVALAAPALGLYLVARRKSFRIANRRDALVLIGLGLMTVIHWATFFGAVQVSSVAIGILSVFTSPILVTFLEPLFDKSKIQAADIAVAVVAFSGIALMIDDYSLGSSVVQGVLLGLCSSVLISFRNIWSKPLVRRYTAPTILFWQMLFGCLCLLPTLLFLEADVTMADLRNLAVLAIFATAFGHSMMLNSIGHLGARATGVIMMIQPLYALSLAALILGEIPTLRVIIGGLLIVGSSGYENLKHRS